MDAVRNSKVIYEFGKFVLDPGERLLLYRDQPVHLRAKEFDTLLLFLENNGRAITKEEMMSVLWQGAFVEEGNLVKQISRLRKILNTDGEQFIETIPKHGYRFYAEVRVTQFERDDPVILETRAVNRNGLKNQEERTEIQLPIAENVTPAGRLRRLGYLFPAIVSLSLLGGLLYLWYGSTSDRKDSGSDIKSIAVLPFKPVTGEAIDEHLRLGLTDTLITKLSNLKHIVVRPTNAVRHYASQDAVTAGRELAVDAVLEGSIQRIDQRVRVNVQLINVSDGKLVWGGKFDENFTDVLNVQDAIAVQVAHALKLELTGEDQRLLAKRYTTNPEAHYSYVRGRFAWNKRTLKDLSAAIGHFNDAIAKDPNYALAYAGLADSYSLLADYRGGPAIQLYDQAKVAALKAIALDDTLAEAHTSLAYINMYRFWDWQAAESGYRTAIEMNPNYATARHWYSEYLTAMGRFDEALTEIRRAKEIDPLSLVINAGEVWILYHARRYDEAIDHGRRLQELNPEFTEVNEYLKRCYDQRGLYREAIAARQMRRKLAGVDATETPALKRAANAGKHEDYWKSRLEQEIEDARTEPPAPFDMAEIYAQIGNKDKAFEWLEKAVEERNYLIMYLRVTPNLDPLRSDPRFTELLVRTGLS